MSVWHELAGTLRERIAIERLGPERDALGGAAGTWEPEAMAWALIEPDGRAAEARAGARDAALRWRVTMRTREIGLEHRLVWNGLKLRVRAVERDPRSPDRITIAAEEER